MHCFVQPRTDRERTSLGVLGEHTGNSLQSGLFGSQLHAFGWFAVGVPAIGPAYNGESPGSRLRALVNRMVRRRRYGPVKQEKDMQTVTGKAAALCSAQPGIDAGASPGLP